MQRILVTGAGGFIGRHLVAALVRDGCKVLAPVRRRDRARAIWFLPGVDVVQADVLNPATLEASLAECDACINLVGILHGGKGQPYGEGFQRLHVELPERLAQLASAQGKRLVHVSALGAHSQGRSMYLRSKGDGEAAIRNAGSASAGLDWRIVRPSVVFGEGDHFIAMLARLTRLFWLLPLAAPHAKLQPLWVGDLVQALLTCLREDGARGKVFELGGPGVHTLMHIANLVAQAQGARCAVVPLPELIGRMQAALLERLPGPLGELLTLDNLDSLASDSVLQGHLPGFAALGVSPRPLEPWLAHEAFPQHDPWIVRRARAHASLG